LQSIEANKMATLAAEMEKIELATKKREEQSIAFMAQTKEALDQRIQSSEERREAYLGTLKAKLKEHVRFPAMKPLLFVGAS